ncbi:MAG: hypothetical protein KDB14_01535 [Planctomycetales bacterium]|nr:hypothetical protein [Planctomycetales bacterium]
MLPLRFSLRTLLVMVTLLALAIVCWRTMTHATIARALRQDLALPRTTSLKLLEFRKELATERDVALFVTHDGQQYELSQASRHVISPLANSKWTVDQVSIFYTDGFEQWELFARTYDHFPTRAEIQEFRQWLAQW